MTYEIPQEELDILEDTEKGQTTVWNVDSKFYGQKKSGMNAHNMKKKSNKQKNRPLTELQDKLVTEVVLNGHSVEKAKEIAGYSDVTRKQTVVASEKVQLSLEERRKEMWEKFETHA